MKENSFANSSTSDTNKFPSLGGIIKGTNFKDSPLGIQIANVLTEAILENQISGGDQLLELELQKEFNTSRTPIREAFRELEKRGLVEVIPRKGTFVRRIDREDIEENFPVRAVLEALAAKLAYFRLTDENLQDMALALKKMKSAMMSNDAKSYWKAHLRFHDIFVFASGNRLLFNTLQTLRLHLSWFRLSYKFYREGFREHYDLHHRIYDLFCDKNQYNDEIELLVKGHIEKSLERFIAYLEEQKS